MFVQAAQPPAISGSTLVPSWVYGLAPSGATSRWLTLDEGASASIVYSQGDEVGVVTAVVPRAVGLSAEGFCAGVAAVYGAVLDTLRGNGFGHPVRIWSFVPGIHGRMGDGVDRYRLFNMGRHEAFARWFGGASAFASVLPAATAVGHFGDDLVVCAVGMRGPGIAIENPRQIPASAYSRAHGPLPPCFARAMAVRLAVGPRLLVSGTASIRGEDSVHAGSLSDQLAETFENLERLVRSVDGVERYELSGVETARVYFPRGADRAALEEGVAKRLPEAAAVEFVPAWICREELLVEIEATLAPVTP